MREENNGTLDVSLCNHVWELGFFEYGFLYNEQRLSMFNQTKNFMKDHVRDDIHNAPWLLNKRLKIYSRRALVRNLKNFQCCRYKNTLCSFIAE